MIDELTVEQVLKFLGPPGEEIYRAQILRGINEKWGIKNPPPWLICQQMGRPYLLEGAR